jgi:hypothetical protein
LEGVTVDTKSLAHPAHPSTRELRALKLFRERRHEIKEVAPNLYRVPSCAGDRVYTVDYDLERCSCPDARRHPELSCKHLIAIGILVAKRRARTAPCAGCGERFRRRELYEVCEDHGSLTYFVGDRLCEECALAGGIL